MSLKNRLLGFAVAMLNRNLPIGYACESCGGMSLHDRGCYLTLPTGEAEAQAWAKVEAEIASVQVAATSASVIGHEFADVLHAIYKLRAAIREWGYAYHLDRFRAKETHVVDQHNAGNFSRTTVRP